VRRRGPQPVGPGAPVVRPGSGEGGSADLLGVQAEGGLLRGVASGSGLSVRGSGWWRRPCRMAPGARRDRRGLARPRPTAPSAGREPARPVRPRPAGRPRPHTGAAAGRPRRRSPRRDGGRVPGRAGPGDGVALQFVDGEMQLDHPAADRGRLAGAGAGVAVSRSRCRWGRLTTTLRPPDDRPALTGPWAPRHTARRRWPRPGRVRPHRDHIERRQTARCTLPRADQPPPRPLGNRPLSRTALTLGSAAAGPPRSASSTTSGSRANRSAGSSRWVSLEPVW
jgi:hypothetical protein